MIKKMQTSQWIITRPMCVAVGLLLLTLSGLAGAVDPQFRARYQLEIIADWSVSTHPTGFPPSPHFSRVVGANHNAQTVLWRSGELASAGIESMAELGGTSVLSSEVSAMIAAGTAEQVLLGPGIGLSPDTAGMEFVISDAFPLLSLTTMLAPSPDWFAGVDSLDLRGAEGWLEQLEIDLFTYDAGTDSGPNYTSANADTNPAEPIALITESPFDTGLPVMRFVFTLLGTQDYFPLAGHHSGLYSDPARDGEGINLSVAEFADRWAVTTTWFSYLNGNQLWLVGSADFEPGDAVVTVDLYVTSGADFGANFDPNDVEVTLWGSVELGIPKCGFLDASYASDDGTHAGQLQLAQLVPIGQLDCN